MRLFSKSPLITVILAITTLAACTTNSPQPTDDHRAAAMVEQKPSTPSPEEPLPTRDFPTETLYSLIAAELAGSRERFDIALGNYMQQAFKTRDAGVAARATHIARYLNAQQAIITSATLWAELAPNDLEARFTAGTALSQNGQLLKATEHSLFLLEQKGTGIFQSIALEAAKSTDTQREQLINRYTALLNQYPRNTELMTALAILSHQQGDTEQALKLAQQALDIEPKLIQAATLEARLLLSAGQEGKALVRLEKMLSQHPNDRRVRLQYARLLAGVDLKAAQAEFETLLQQSPDDPALLFSLALLTQELGEIDTAKSYFTNLLTFPSRASSAHYYLGRIAEAEEDQTAALEHYFQVLPGKDFTAALLHSTDILISNNQIEQANSRLKTVREKFPDQSERLFLIESEVLNNHKQWQAAKDLLSSALQQHPTSTKLLYSRAMVHEQLNQLPALEADLKTLLKYEPDNATALNALGYTLVNRTNRIEEAEELIQKALQIRPNDAAIIDSLGWLHFKQGDIDAALIRLKQAMTLMPDHEIAAHLGEVLWLMNEKDEAQKIWQQGLELKSDSGIIRDTMERLIP